MVGEPNTIPVQNAQPVTTQPIATPPVNPTPDVTSPVANPIVPSNNKSKMWLWIIIGVALITIVAVASFLLLSNKDSSLSLEEIGNLKPSEILAYTETEIIGICDVIFTETEKRLKPGCSNETIKETWDFFAEALTPILEAERGEECLSEEKGYYWIFEEECTLSTEEIDLIITGGSHSFGGSTGCFDASATITIVDGPNTFMDLATNTSSVEVHRATGNFTLIGLVVGFGAGGNTMSKIWTGELPSKNGNAIQVFNVEFGYGEVAEEVTVAAIIQVGNTETTCDRSGMNPLPLKS